MYSRVFTKVKNIIPKISETELIALRSGGVSIDRDIFSGIINYDKLKKTNTTPDVYKSRENNMMDKTRYILKNMVNKKFIHMYMVLNKMKLKTL
jgi:hypothetical protein